MSRRSKQMGKVLDIAWMLFCVFVIATMLVTLRRELNEIKTLQGFQQVTLEQILNIQTERMKCIKPIQ